MTDTFRAMCAELVEALHEHTCLYEGHESKLVARARALLAQPVAVSERLPGPQDCTAQGWCWVFYKGFATWTLEPPLGQDGKHTGYTHWLPADALPIPEATND